ncbi:MAG: MFS transporter [Anaerolineae bacterium]|nr:MFS transporter [Anaerolineae bacterium]
MNEGAEQGSGSFWINLFYAMPTLGNTMLWSIASGWLLYFYLPPEGEGVALVPAAFYSVTILVTRTVNAVLAPFIGYLSDRTHTRWGRRLVFMALSALPMLALFVLVWTPPVKGESAWNLVYLALIYVLYNLCYSLNQIPYTALLPELARTDRHRVQMSAWTSGFFLVGMILGGLGGLAIEQVGYPAAAMIYAALALPLLYLPFLILRERPGRAIAAQDRLNFRQSVAAMVRNPAFATMAATGVFYWGVTTLIQAIIPYIVTQVCLLDTADTYAFYVPGILAALLCYPLVTWLANKFGKYVVFAGSLLASAAVLPGVMVIGEWLPLSLKAQGVIWVVLQAIALSGVTMLPAAFGAEIVDLDAELTGQRREGIYYAAWGLMDQVVNGLAAALLPVLLLLGSSQSSPRGPLGVRMVGVVGGGMMLAAFVVFLRYPLRPGQVYARGGNDER